MAKNISEIGFPMYIGGQLLVILAIAVLVVNLLHKGKASSIPYTIEELI